MSVMALLVVVLAGGVLLLVMVWASHFGRRNRRGANALERRALALDVLRQIAEDPRPIASYASPREPEPFGSVRMLDTANMRNVRTMTPARKTHSTRRRAVHRPKPADVALRPTVAQLPTTTRGSVACEDRTTPRSG